MPTKWISVLLLLQLSGHFSPGSCGKVLVWPTEYSHWINMKTILDALVQRGHQVTEEMFWEGSDFVEKLCKDAVFNKKLMRKLQESRFDVVLADAFGACGQLLAELLNIPFMYSLRFSPGYKIEKYSGGLPFPPSYVPVVFSELSDQMTFMERVLWRFEGKKPDTLGPNTRLYKWIPQNDLLGHPKTKAFITHGGTNGIYEAIYHGIPMVGIPMFVDQPDNIAPMKTKGTAIILDFNTMSSADLLNALKTFINDPS
ncbi:PREDICTED: UDP-glucuronosyltransferase 2B31-like [Myotis davidii]|uniref:UDP-glucuronosyltransferase 2B31-like n=1 Tax=Myotis davidii TaxID=225400 RepID=UPI0003EBE18A|nr:PREDICTED: UDP-glucuronosyltransferase 2B31-like [Myotis davidii]